MSVPGGYHRQKYLTDGGVCEVCGGIKETGRRKGERERKRGEREILEVLQEGARRELEDKCSYLEHTPNTGYFFFKRSQN